MGVTQHVAADLTLSVESRIRARCGADSHYIPGQGKDARNSFIFAAFSSGEGLDDIARRHELSTRQVRRVLEDYGVSWET